MLKPLIATTLCVAGLTACGLVTAPAPSPAQPKFQMVTAPDGRMLRLNSQTGEVFEVGADGLIAIREKSALLKVGDYVEMADAKDDTKFLLYLGEGKFEASKWAVRKISD